MANQLLLVVFESLTCSRSKYYLMSFTSMSLFLWTINVHTRQRNTVHLGVWKSYELCSIQFVWIWVNIAKGLCALVALIPTVIRNKMTNLFHISKKLWIVIGNGLWDKMILYLPWKMSFQISGRGEFGMWKSIWWYGGSLAAHKQAVLKSSLRCCFLSPDPATFPLPFFNNPAQRPTETSVPLMETPLCCLSTG